MRWRCVLVVVLIGVFVGVWLSWIGFICVVCAVGVMRRC